MFKKLQESAHLSPLGRSLYSDSGIFLRRDFVMSFTSAQKIVMAGSRSRGFRNYILGETFRVILRIDRQICRPVSSMHDSHGVISFAVTSSPSCYDRVLGTGLRAGFNSYELKCRKTFWNPGRAWAVSPVKLDESSVPASAAPPRARASRLLHRSPASQGARRDSAWRNCSSKRYQRHLIHVNGAARHSGARGQHSPAVQRTPTLWRDRPPWIGCSSAVRSKIEVCMASGGRDGTVLAVGQLHLRITLTSTTTEISGLR